jgi:phosphoribosylaminoimidazole-succinocarboxamide synthase
MTATNIKDYNDQIRQAIPYCLTETHLDVGAKYQGKVRDTYDLGDKLLLITTDRQSAFDRVLAAVPYKGQVLNLTSAWWFENRTHYSKSCDYFSGSECHDCEKMQCVSG